MDGWIHNNTFSVLIVLLPLILSFTVNAFPSSCTYTAHITHSSPSKGENGCVNRRVSIDGLVTRKSFRFPLKSYSFIICFVYFPFNCLLFSLYIYVDVDDDDGLSLSFIVGGFRFVSSLSSEVLCSHHFPIHHHHHHHHH